MKILKPKEQDKILEEITAIDDILDDFSEAKFKCIEHIVEIVSIACGLSGLIAMRDHSQIKAYRALGEFAARALKEAGEEE